MKKKHTAKFHTQKNSTCHWEPFNLLKGFFGEPLIPHVAIINTGRTKKSHSWTSPRKANTQVITPVAKSTSVSIS